MIRLLIRQKLEDKKFKENRKITLNEVSDKTGISRAALNRMVNKPTHNTSTDSLNTLCNYFGCTVAEIIEYIPD